MQDLYVSHIAILQFLTILTVVFKLCLRTNNEYALRTSRFSLLFTGVNSCLRSS